MFKTALHAQTQCQLGTSQVRAAHAVGCLAMKDWRHTFTDSAQFCRQERSEDAIPGAQELIGIRHVLFADASAWLWAYPAIAHMASVCDLAAGPNAKRTCTSQATLLCCTGCTKGPDCPGRA